MSTHFDCVLVGPAGTAALVPIVSPGSPCNSSCRPYSGICVYWEAVYCILRVSGSKDSQCTTLRVIHVPRPRLPPHATPPTPLGKVAFNASLLLAVRLLVGRCLESRRRLLSCIHTRRAVRRVLAPCKWTLTTPSRRPRVAFVFYVALRCLLHSSGPVASMRVLVDDTGSVAHEGCSGGHRSCRPSSLTCSVEWGECAKQGEY